ncbi:MAG: prolipoprotein diacylglyceryl transferase [Bacteroidetes bacterium]|nr:MAG: prolipoprotein diacylglyceryl transferase [Bacteroidota bacterium]
MTLFNYIVWDPNKEIFRLPINDHPIVWYGLLFAMAFIIGQQIMFYIFKSENKTRQDVETLTLYMVIATVIGARLGHCLFYDPLYYLQNPLDILKVWEGGLASHGAAIGILTCIYIYSRKKAGQSYLWVVDRVAIIVALAGSLIRFGNFINSEIVGLPTDSSNGVVFARVLEEAVEADQFIKKAEASKASPAIDSLDMTAPVLLRLEFNAAMGQAEATGYLQNRLKNILISLSSRSDPHVKYSTEEPLAYRLVPSTGGGLAAEVLIEGIPRHPAQLYESISSLLLFFFLLYLWSRKKAETPEGLIFSLFLIILFGLRFVYEFFKENQKAFEDDIPLNMGQWLSIPLIIAGIILIFRVIKEQKVKVPDHNLVRPRGDNE